MNRANALAQYLREEVGIDARAYHGRLEPSERISIENDLLDNKLKVVIATSALGMGFDKPDLGFLIHLGIPKTMTDYYQQIGRAGRQLENADCILLSLPDDDDINDYFIKPEMNGRGNLGTYAMLLNKKGVNKRFVLRSYSCSNSIK